MTKTNSETEHYHLLLDKFREVRTVPEALSIIERIRELGERIVTRRVQANRMIIVWSWSITVLALMLPWAAWHGQHGQLWPWAYVNLLVAAAFVVLAALSRRRSRRRIADLTEVGRVHTSGMDTVREHVLRERLS